MNLNEMTREAAPQEGGSPQQTPATPEQQAQFDLLLGRARQVM